MLHDHGMENYCWSHILDDAETTRNTINCSKYREQYLEVIIRNLMYHWLASTHLPAHEGFVLFSLW